MIATPAEIKTQIKAANQAAIKLAGTTQQPERVTLRIDKDTNTAVFLYPDDAANTGMIAASFWDCGGLHYAEVSYDWYYKETLSPLTTTISEVARAEFAASLEETIEQVDRTYIAGYHAEYTRFVPHFVTKLCRK